MCGQALIVCCVLNSSTKCIGSLTLYQWQNLSAHAHQVKTINYSCIHIHLYTVIFCSRYNQAIHGLFEKKGVDALSHKRENKNR